MDETYFLLTNPLLEENFAPTWVEEDTFVLKHIGNKKFRRIKEVPATENDSRIKEDALIYVQDLKKIASGMVTPLIIPQRFYQTMEEIKSALNLKIQYAITKEEHNIIREVTALKSKNELEELIAKLFKVKGIKYLREALNQL